MEDDQLFDEAPGMIEDPYKAAFFLGLNMVSCPNCGGVEFFTEDRTDGTVDGVCLDCGKVWSLGSIGDPDVP